MRALILKEAAVQVQTLLHLMQARVEAVGRSACGICDYQGSNISPSSLERMPTLHRL
jgi:hypothetical protein